MTFLILFLLIRSEIEWEVANPLKDFLSLFIFLELFLLFFSLYRFLISILVVTFFNRSIGRPSFLGMLYDISDNDYVNFTIVGEIWLSSGYIWIDSCLFTLGIRIIVNVSFFSFAKNFSISIDLIVISSKISYFALGLSFISSFN